MNLILPALLVFAAICLAWFWYEGRWDRRLFTAEVGRKCVNVRARGARELLQTQTDAQVLDVRSRKEFAGGAVPGAINVSLGDATFRERVADLDRTRPVLVYCAGGFRSRKAVEVLRALGFQSIYHLHRGYHSWKFAGLPVAKTANP
ncbi:MAG: rhodanese-like domain-containing protein [Chthoniobacter sp.]|uniref:rhodanese-like domain-containing protein n=1 Tax=Chthoniobacter sp. TaxID=2510640 RepID=UPI0032ACC0D5